MKKRIIVLMLLFSMVLSLTGCKSPAGKEVAETGKTVEETTDQSAVRGGVGDGKYKEAPSLLALVEKGELPPIEERLPKEPFVLEVDEIGIYGGTYVGAAFGPSQGQLDTEGLRFQNLLTIEKDLETFKPNIIKALEVNEDKTEYKIQLREGMKWSNGDDFTTDDWMFWYEGIFMNRDVVPSVEQNYCSNGEPMVYEQIDQYNLVIKFAYPNPNFTIFMASGWSTGINRSFFAPKKYLSTYHKEYNAEADKLAKDEGYESWVLCFQAHLNNTQSKTDVNAPEMAPWVLNRIDANGNKFFVRNPYYWVVDQEGNQLPYIDEQQALIVQDKDVRNLKLISGEIHAAGENPLPLSDYTMLKENEQKGNYTVLLFGNTRGADCTFTFNLTSKEPLLREAFNKVEFRQAMSYALDRDTINKTLYYGKGTIRQATAASNISFMKTEFETAYTEYDVDKANALLDECGYPWNASKTARLLPEGKEFSIVLESIEEFAPVSEMACEYWNKVGIKVTFKQEERSYYIERGVSNDRQMQAFTLDQVGEFNLKSKFFNRMRPGNAFDDLEFMRTYKEYWDSDGEKGEEPPAEITKLREDCLTFGTLSSEDPQYAVLGESILKRISDNCFFIGVTVSPRIIIFNNRLGNTPTEGTFASDYCFWMPYRGDSWYFK